jgi:hypothetical protein
MNGQKKHTVKEAAAQAQVSDAPVLVSKVA